MEEATGLQRSTGVQGYKVTGVYRSVMERDGEGMRREDEQGREGKEGQEGK
jgi:hypothetical protein